LRSTLAPLYPIFLLDTGFNVPRCSIRNQANADLPDVLRKHEALLHGRGFFGKMKTPDLDGESTHAAYRPAPTSTLSAKKFPSSILSLLSSTKISRKSIMMFEKKPKGGGAQWIHGSQ
jgi:hypothetical protein